jgi:catecholate siderophore receptor
LDPEKSRTYEVGTKWALADGTLTLSGSVFRIEKRNARVPSATTPGFNDLGGDQRAQGVEVEMVGRLTPQWDVRAGYSYLDTEVTRTTPGGPLLGAPLPMAPRNTASVWSSYELSSALSVGLGALSISSRLGQDTAAAYLTAPGYVTVDAMVKYRLGTDTAVQLNIQNLTNKYYYDELHPFHIIPGAGRSAQLSVTWNR